MLTKCAERIALLLLLVHMLNPNLSALDPEQPPGKFLVDEWKVSRGLPSDTINAMVQTRDGYLYIGTNKELVRFDGLKFEIIDFYPDNKNVRNRRISALFVDKNGVLWIGHAGGLTRYKNRSFKTFSSRDGLSGERISGIFADSSGSLWIGTANNYLNRMDRGTFSLFAAEMGLQGKFITAILEDSHGFLWVSTLLDGLHRFQYGKFTKVSVPGMTHRHSLHALYEDRAGFLWIGTNMGLFRVKDEEVKIYTTRDGLSDNRVNEILTDSDGNLWVGTVNGLNRLREGIDGKVHIESCFKNHYINCLFEDREKSLWVGTNGSALKRLREGVFTTYSTEKGVANFVSSLYEDKRGTIWIGTDYGQLYFFKDDRFVEFPIEKDILDLRIRTLGEDLQGRVLVGTIRDGVFRVGERGLSKYPLQDALSGSIIQAIFKDSKNHLWIGTMGKGLFHIHQGVFKHYSIGDGLLSNVIINIVEDKSGAIWVTTSQGINFLQDRQFKQVKRYLEGVFTLAVYEDNAGTFWIGTLGRGLFRFKDGKFAVLTRENELGSNNIFQILEDQREYLWMSSDVGILRVSKKEVDSFFNGEAGKVNCIVYGISDGLKSVECNSWGRDGAVKTGQGEFWFATKKGVSVVQPGKLKTEKLPPPPVIIERIVVNGETGENFSSPNRFKDSDTIEIYFTAAAFIALERVKFKYRLAGVDKNWLFLKRGEKRVVKYANLPVGEYTFTVTACSSDGVWNEKGASLTLSVSSGFPVSGFILILFFLGIISSVLLWYGLRKKVFPGKEEVKKYKTSTLDREKAEEIVKKLNHLLEYEHVYRDEKVSLQSLARELSISYHLLSQVINEQLHKNFFELINTYRIEEAKKRLADPKEGARSILAIAYDVGFNTKAAFNRVFKKHAGMTPSQYRKKFKE